MPNPPRNLAHACFVVLLGLAQPACLYDAGQRCGPAMTYVEAANGCVCNADAIAVQGGCQECAADEVVSNGECACPAGQAKNAADVCAAATALGRACDTAIAPCTDAVYSYCAVTGGTTGTCTSRCTSNTECAPAYTCATWDAHPYCRTFDGFGASCVTTADCTGDANFCDTFQTHRCGIQGCSLTADNCPRGTLCCDFSLYGLGTLCAGACL